MKGCGSAPTRLTLTEYLTSKLKETFRKGSTPPGWTTETIVVSFEVLGCMCDDPLLFPAELIVATLCSSARKWIRRVGEVEGTP